MARRWNRIVVVAAAFVISGCSVLIGLEDDYEPASEAPEASTSVETGTTNETGTSDGGVDAPPDGLPATCINQIKDGTETDIDCGGSACLPCANQKACAVDRDCVSGACDGGCKPWLKSFGAQGASAGDGNAVAVGASGDIAICGTATVAVDFGGGSLAGRGLSDVVVAKFASNGTLTWARRFGGADDELCSSVAMDAAGNVVISGTYYDGPTFDLGDGALPKVSGSEAFVAKLTSATGAPLWAIGIATADVDRAYGVAVDPTGDVLATGQIGGALSIGGNTIGAVNTDDIFVVKLAGASGVATWAKSYGSVPGSGGANGDDVGRAVATDALGNVFVTGSFRGATLTIGGTTLTAAAEHDAFVFALSGAGAPLWATRYGGASTFITGGPEEGFGIAAIPGGGVFVTGRVTTSGAGEAFVAKLASDGGLVWDTVRGGTQADVGNGVAVDTAGNALVIGRFNSSSITFAPVAPLVNPNPTGNRGDVFLVKLAASDGKVLFAERYGGSDFDIGFGVASRRGNSIIVGTAAPGMTVRGLPVTEQIFLGSLGPLP